MFSFASTPMQRGSALLVAFVLALSALAPFLVPPPAQAGATPVFINEIHYDNDGADSGEAIEVAGPAGTDLSDWSLVLYNGANGATYDTIDLSGEIPEQQSGHGTLSFARSGIQNGSPDGVVLFDGTNVVQFLSYEGTLTATNGPANGTTSVDIGVQEAANSTVGHSLQLGGTGTTYEDFTWADSQPNTFGLVNTGQTFGSVVNAPVTADCGEPVVTPEGDDATTTVSATDVDGTVTELDITGVTPTDPNITIGTTTPAASDGGEATAVVTVGTATAAGTYAVEITATNDDAEPQTGTCTLSVTVEASAGAVPGVVISEFRTRGPDGAADEFIEIHNPTLATVDVSGWLVRGSNNNAFVGTRATIDSGTQLMPGCFYLVANTSYGGGVAADQTYGTGITDTGGIGLVMPDGTTVVDAVGMDAGSAFGEGTPLAPMSGTADQSYERRPGGVAGHATDTGDNATDFALITPSNPQNSSSTCIGQVPADEAPEVDSTTPADGAVGVENDASISITFSEAVDVAEGWYEIDCSVSGTHTATESGGPTTFALDPDEPFVSGDTCTVTIVAANVTDQDADDPPDAMDADHVFSFSVGTVCGNWTHFIHQVQGDGAASPVEGLTVTVEGVVVGDYQGDDPGLEGFFIQEEDGHADGDPDTSEGIFVFDDSGSVPVAPGDLVNVTGEVDEFFGLTEITDVTNVSVCESEDEDPPAVVTPTVVTLPVADVDDLERYEGMLVKFEQILTVTENFNLGRFGEVVLSASGRQFQGTHVAEPGAPAAEVADLNSRSRITLDDGDGSQNDDPTVHPPGGLSASNTLRTGATTTGLTGVMDFDFGLYKIQPIDEVDFDGAANRPANPPNVGGSIQVAAFNVLNYFNGDGEGDFSDPDNRGAENQFEFDRQRDKIIEAISRMGAEVVGLMEIENDDAPTEYAAIEDLVDGLNEELGAGTYDFIETGRIGTDAIAVAIIYQPDAVTPLGDFAILDSSEDPRFDDERNRPMLAQTFTETATGESFTVAVNHLKSKGSGCGAGDDEEDTSGGNCNGTRTAAAEAIVDWLAGDPTDTGETDVLVIGDLNSYAKENPIDVLRAGGYVDLLAQFHGPNEHTYVFFGASGYLDYAMSSASLTAKVTGASAWHINTDEPSALDYNTNFKSANHVSTLYDDGPYRSSDHDPVIVGLNLQPAGEEPTPTPDPTPTPPDATATPTPTREGTLPNTATDVGSPAGQTGLFGMLLGASLVGLGLASRRARRH